MKFFDRSKILFRVLSVIAVLLAVILVIKSFSLDTLNIDLSFELDLNVLSNNLFKGMINYGR